MLFQFQLKNDTLRAPCNLPYWVMQSLRLLPWALALVLGLQKDINLNHCDLK